MFRLTKFTITKINRMAKINDKLKTIATGTLEGMEGGLGIGGLYGLMLGLTGGTSMGLRFAVMGGATGAVVGGVGACAVNTALAFPKATAATALAVTGLFAFKYLTPDSSDPIPTNEEPASPRIPN